MVKSRRQAREAALRALYGLEVGKGRIAEAKQEMAAQGELSSELLEFAQELLDGVTAHQAYLDDLLAARIHEYDFDRIAAVDRNLLRIAAYELFFAPNIPPAVSLNEAIDLAKKYSTAESGRFVNGVLANLLLESPKAKWDDASQSLEDEEAPAPETAAEIETIDEASPEAKEFSRIGNWQIRSKDKE